MLQAFGRENNASSIDWEGTYGGGFNVLHLRGAARFFAGGDAIVDGRVRALLAELGVKHAKGSVAASGGGEGSDGREHRGEEVEDGVVGAADIPVRFVDDDASRATVTGGLAIMLYLDAKYFSKSRGVPEQRPAAELAKVYTRVQQALALEDKWRATRARAAMVSEAAGTGESRGTTQKQCPKFNILKALKRELALWDGYAAKAPAEAGGEEVTAQGHCYIAGGEAPSIADFALWPVLHDMAIVCGEDDDAGTSTGGSAASPLLSAALEKSGLGSLVVWYDAFGKRESIRTVFGRGGH
jgi:glutathione S-transferase